MIGPYAATPAACVATAPTPALTQGTTVPTAKYLDCTAQPISPVTWSTATIENVALIGAARTRLAYVYQRTLYRVDGDGSFPQLSQSGAPGSVSTVASISPPAWPA